MRHSMEPTPRLTFSLKRTQTTPSCQEIHALVRSCLQRNTLQAHIFSDANVKQNKNRQLPHQEKLNYWLRLLRGFPILFTVQ